MLSLIIITLTMNIEKSKKIMEDILALMGFVSHINFLLVDYNDYRTMRHLFLFWLTILINAIVLFVVRVPSE